MSLFQSVAVNIDFISICPRATRLEPGSTSFKAERATSVPTPQLANKNENFDWTRNI